MKNYSAWEIQPLPSGKVSQKDLYLNLVGWAILAANSHNVQPWRFILRPEENIIDICVHPSGILSASDAKGRQAHISVGCAVENLLLAADYYSLKAANIQYLGPAVHPAPILRIKFDKADFVTASNPAFLNAMKNRRMNRGKFDPDRPVPEEVLAALKKSVEDSGLFLDIIKDYPTRFAIAEIQYIADRAVLARNDFRYELADYFLPNETLKGMGMPGNTFGLSDKMAAYVSSELNKKGPFDPDLAVGFAISGRDGIKSSPLLGVISISNDNPEQWLKAGRALEKIALLAELNGLGIAVHAAMVEVGVFNQLLKVRLGQSGRPTVIFRIGYANEKRPHSPRLSVEEVTETKD